ncbi:8-oxo-dGTP diphosphatase MutT [Vibrio sp. S11_S32]|uniref:8-oxo-dGTP diphosphatase MutT n=1 Tax=Vibrio sp. S11_S32 TaxID=2720225 RepID=UPI001680D1FB|nr:8-oxo-dGTP diphosphatase MutT [Vibrio sp. S11_S32]MBD1576873.1 8-oxo-dGTP diphosphatase MutT [Vibrio sp. S11_S32]
MTLTQTSRLHIVAAIIFNQQQDQIFITKRPAKLHKGGYWEFPGGKVESGETAGQGLIRELYEEIDIEVTALSLFEHLDHDYPEKKLTFDFFSVTAFSGKPYGKEGQEGKWVKIEDLVDYQFPEANQPIVEKLLATLG